MIATPVQESTKTPPPPPVWKAYVELLKLRLSVLVGLSGVLGYLMGAEAPYSISATLLFALSGLFITGAANATNQVLEVEFDKLMKRTGQRPLPTGRLRERNALAFVAVLLFIGLFIQTLYFNPLTAALSFVSFLLYSFLYTPLKRMGPIAVYVGAIPGGLPPLIGWVAAQGTVGVEAWILFGIQFVWQFTHFWAVAWVLDEDYSKAGFRLLPLRSAKSRNTAMMIAVFTAVLIPLGWLPTYLGMTGTVSGWIALGSAVTLLYYNIRLVQDVSIRSAKQLMFSAFAYLPIVQVAHVLDKL